MPRRRRRLLALTALAALLVALALPAVHWRLIGWWRGEAFYRGRPTSYHRLFGRAYHGPDGGWYIEFLDPEPVIWVRRHVSPWLADRLNPGVPPLAAPDADAVPVLLELLRDPDQSVRVVALSFLGIVRPPAREALPALRALLDGEDGRDPDLRLIIEGYIRDIETGTYR